MDFLEYVMMFGGLMIFAFVLALILDPKGKYNRPKRKKITYKDPRKRIGLPWMGGDWK
ncbi:MAG: hypothetical protein ACI4AN_02630 [Muribaculaceae bacterium]